MASMYVHDWAAKSDSTPVPIGKLPQVIRSAFSKLAFEERGPAHLAGVMKGYPGSKRPKEAMWVGVPQSTLYQEMEGGWWTWGANGNRSNRYFGAIVPAEKDAKVQFGFTMVRVDRAQAYLDHKFGGDADLPRVIKVTSRSTSVFRIDKVMAVLAKMAEDKVLDGLIGKVILSELMADVGRTCYNETEINILDGRGPEYRALMALVMDRISPGWRSPTTLSGIQVLAQVAGLSSAHDTSLFWPYCLVFMVPEPIAVKAWECMAKGISPLIPNWVSRGCHQLNKSWDKPCTGAVTATVRDSYSSKLFAGATNKFNFDAVGNTNRCYMPVPQEWIDLYVEVVNELLKVDLPLVLDDRADVSLSYARRIPTIVDCTGGPKFYRLKNVYTPKLSAYEVHVGGLPVNEGDDEEGTVTVDPEAEALPVCSCGATLIPSTPRYNCSHIGCDNHSCPICDRSCSCCGSFYCVEHRDSHDHTSTHSCLLCPGCNTMRRSVTLVECVDCHRMRCPSCFDTCDCGTVCTGCRGDHVCTGGEG